MKRVIFTLLVGLSIASAEGANLAGNYGFEIGDFTGWYHSGGIAVVSDNGPSEPGIYAMEIPAIKDDLRMPAVPAVEGETFNVSWDYKIATDATVKARVRFFNASGGFLGQDQFLYDTQGDWQTETFISRSAPAGAATVDMVFLINQEGTTGSAFIDNVSIARPPLVANSGFETGDFTNWVHSVGAAVISDNGPSATGVYAVEVAVGEDVRAVFDVAPGRYYNVNWDYKVVGADGWFWGKIRWYDESDADLGEIAFFHELTSWKTRSFIAEAPVGAVTADVIFFNGTATVGSMIVDNISVEDTPSPLLVPNPDFETGSLEDWNHSSGVAVISDNGPSASGIYAAEVPVGDDLRSLAIPMEAGDTFYVSWDYSIAAGDGIAKLRWFDVDSIFLGQTVFNYTPTAGWQTESFISTPAPANTAHADLVFLGSMLVDNVSVERPPLVENPGFETGDFTSWVQPGGAVVVSDNGPSAAGVYAAEVAVGDDLHAVFEVTQGQYYNVGWDYKVVDADGWFWGKIRWYDEFDAVLGEVGFVHEPTSWEARLFSAEAPAGAVSADVTFFNGTATAGSMIVDNISVVEANPHSPIPEIYLAIERRGASAFSLTWDTAAWGNYTVLSTTNLTLPSWSTLMTDIPGGLGGSLTVTNTSDSTETFYRATSR